MKTVAIALGILSALSILSDIAVLVAVRRLRDDHNANTSVLVDAHNKVGGRVTDLTETVLKGIDFLAQERIGR